MLTLTRKKIKISVTLKKKREKYSLGLSPRDTSSSSLITEIKVKFKCLAISRYLGFISNTPTTTSPTSESTGTCTHVLSIYSLSHSPDVSGWESFYGVLVYFYFTSSFFFFYHFSSSIFFFLPLFNSHAQAHKSSAKRRRSSTQAGRLYVIT